MNPERRDKRVDASQRISKVCVAFTHSEVPFGARDLSQAARRKIMMSTSPDKGIVSTALYSPAGSGCSLVELHCDIFLLDLGCCVYFFYLSE